MHSNGHSSTSVFRTIFVVAIAMLMMLVAATPMLAQSSVPPTAVQAAKLPRYASRLAHPVKRLTPPKSQVVGRPTKQGGPLDSGDIYDNGPINGNTDAWTINFGFVVSDTFNVTADSTTVTGMTFAAWLIPGDTLTSAELSITSGENGGTRYFDQTVTFTQGSCTNNEYGYNVCTETASFTGPTLNAGTYWVNLQNASVPSGDPVYWEENSGTGCNSPGCPSLASQNSIGSIPSESFTILGNATTTTTTTYYSDYACPRPQAGFHDLRDFSAHAGPSGVAIDTGGNLYATLREGGSHGAGVLYDLAQRAGHWFFSSLYSFLGGSSGSSPDGVIVGPGGVLYGAASGGIQNCGGGYCGLIYEARPSPTACATALCNWNETTIYQFTSNTDAESGTVSAFDSAGNLYGISAGGGAYGAGTVFELSPTSGGWTEQVLYSFTGRSDGGYPNSLVLGHDGNLYGTAFIGGIYACAYTNSWCGVAFQLVPSGGGWTENVIYTFTGSYTDGEEPFGLIESSQGTLYGLSAFEYGAETNGLIFSLSRSGGGWALNAIHTYNYNECQLSGNVTYHALATDAAGNLYATEGGANAGQCGPDGCDLYYCGGVLNVASGTPLVTGHADVFFNLAADADGNLYGTTQTCGFGTLSRTNSMVWQYSP